jgi:hypothetical protein
MARKIIIGKEYKATYTKWGSSEDIYFIPSALNLEDSDIFTILPKNNIVNVVKGKRRLSFSTEEYSGDRYICSKYMENVHEVKSNSQ